MSDSETKVRQVRERYAEIARSEDSCGCGPNADSGLGCGAPLAELALKPGETVIDLGSGPGLEVLEAARAVGPGGRAIGVDMTPEMLARARASAARAGLDNVEFREGRLEALPVASDSADAVTSNCVINLVPDKEQVFREIARVLKPGGRLVISDIVLDGRLPEQIENDVHAYVGCVSGAAPRETYLGWLAAAGLGEVEILSDADYLAELREVAPADTDELLRRGGVVWDDLAGRVRSVTLRARKPAAASDAACCGPSCCAG
jgi:SAM-dependent methyltransferase